MKKHKCAVVYSGGKDSHLALLESRRVGETVSCLVCFDGGKNHELHFHDTRKMDLLGAHARLLGVPLVKVPVSAGFKAKYIERNIKKLAGAALKETDFDTLVSGVARCRCGGKVNSWKKAADSFGIRLTAPVIGFDLIYAAKICLEMGVKALITGVERGKVDARWLGREMDADFIAWLEAKKASGQTVDGGDVQTVVLASPAFAGRIVPVKCSRSNMPEQELLNIEKFKVIAGRRGKGFGAK